MNMSNDDELISEWQAVQHEIASKVHILDDEKGEDQVGPFPASSLNGAAADDNDGCAKSTSTSTSSGGSERFYSLPLNVNGGKNDLYGGVDVSFAPAPTDDCDGQSTSISSSNKGDDMAVAVYVIIRRKDTAGTATASAPIDISSKLNNNNKSSRKEQPQLHDDILSRNYELIYSDYIRYELTVPYVSTYLAFREIDPLQKLVRRQLEQYPQYTPRAILVDGNGILHPRRAGIACFLGVRTGIPTIGVGKKLCCVEEDWSSVEAEDRICMGLNEAAGLVASVLPADAGVQRTDEDGALLVGKQKDMLIVDNKTLRFDCRSSPNSDECTPCPTESVAKLVPFCSGYTVYLQSSSGNVLGAVLVGHGGKSGHRRGIASAKPIYISVGYEMSLQTAIRLCAELSDFRIPEPVRVADLFGRKLIREDVSSKRIACRTAEKGST